MRSNLPLVVVASILSVSSGCGDDTRGAGGGGSEGSGGAATTSNTTGGTSGSTTSTSSTSTSDASSSTGTGAGCNPFGTGTREELQAAWRDYCELFQYLYHEVCSELGPDQVRDACLEYADSMAEEDAGCEAEGVATLRCFIAEIAALEWSTCSCVGQGFATDLTCPSLEAACDSAGGRTSPHEAGPYGACRECQP